MMMTNNGAGGDKVKPNSNGQYLPPPDALDIADLFIKSDQGDPLTAVTLHKIPVGKPKDFFRTVPDPSYRARAEIYIHKSENEIGETTYIIGPALRGQIEEASPCILITVVDRLGNPRIWPIKTPKEGGKDNASWSTARAIARDGLTQWVRLVWVNTGTGFAGRVAEEKYAPEPDFSRLPPFNELINAGFGVEGVIRDRSHPIYRGLFGLTAPKSVDENADPLV
jgi:hypothetical protein